MLYLSSPVFSDKSCCTDVVIMTKLGPKGKKTLRFCNQTINQQNSLTSVPDPLKCRHANMCDGNT